ncbi:hypothetical protein [Streptomyces natalensis]|uniref:Uncharacterized protein n=1 Tax=Streptomyces natalensis ATCC 27448 TaxID=1240678 RepID=A0A0D7CP10_9ACTN|nr:hypothetical protein [Streptomyces natalensis]KIZ17771.1 hypothetical protein SNA_12325 [Streptomyces natalensis ATCC 27448]
MGALALNGDMLMNFVLLRFALIAGGVLLLAIIAFAALLYLRRRGTAGQETLNRAREHAVPLARTVLDSRRHRDRRR